MRQGVSNTNIGSFRVPASENSSQVPANHPNPSNTSSKQISNDTPVMFFFATVEHNQSFLSVEQQRSCVFIRQLKCNPWSKHLFFSIFGDKLSRNASQ